MAIYTSAQGCPKCGGQSGYEFEMIEIHHMTGAWGGLPQSGDNSGQRIGLVSCLDCWHRFRMDTLSSRGAIGGEEAVGVSHYS